MSRPVTKSTDTEKLCCGCQQWKPFSEFYRSAREADGHQYRCRDCARLKTKKWREENPGRHKGYWLRHRYGIEYEDYQRMYQSQDGRCLICGDAYVVLHVDHDHKTDKIRGLLCDDCNNGLGRFRDDMELLRGAIGYLEAHYNVSH